MRRRERRVVRPILTLDAVLSETAMRLHPDGPFTTEPSLQLPPEGIECAPQVRPVIQTSVLQEKCADVWNKLVFVLHVIERSIHRSTPVFTCPLDDVPDEIDLTAADRSRSIYWGGVTSYIASIALAEATPGTESRRPFRKGHWIARKRFDVQTRQLNEGFPIEIWGADKFQEHGFPSRTAFCVLVDDENALLDQTDGIDTAITVAVHEDMAYVIGRDKELQYMFVVEVVTEILYRALRALVHNRNDISVLPENSYIAQWISRLRRGSGITEARLLQAVAQEDYAFIRSVVQSRYDLLSELGKSSR